MSDAGDERMRDFSDTFPALPGAPDGALCDRCPMQGPRGPEGRPGRPGERGVKGERGGALSPALRRAIAYLFVLMFVLIGLAYAGIAYQQHVSNQQRCGGISAQVAIPIPVPTAGNPSRAWVARYSAIERHRGAQLGCDMPPPRFVHVPGG